MPIKQIDIKNTSVNYYEEGLKNPIIFLHGWGQSLESFNYFYSKLAQNYHIYALDFPGFGNSVEPKNPVDIYYYEEILSEFINKLEIVNPIIVGHSFGCRVALIYAAKNENLSKLIFTGAAGLKPKRNFKYHLSVINYKFMKLLVKTPFYYQYKDDLFANSGSTDYKNASDVMKQVLIKVVNEDLSNLLERVHVNTLLYWGSVDESTPLEFAYIMNSRIPNSKLVVKEGASHYAFLENKEDFIKEILSFIK